MRAAAAVGVGVAVLAAAGIVALAYAGRPSAPEFSAALRPPMPVGSVFMVTYGMPAGMTKAQALALLAFVAAWGAPLDVPQFSSARDGSPTVSVSARVEVEQPKGPPTIPSPAGNLVPLAWSETAASGQANA